MQYGHSLFTNFNTGMTILNVSFIDLLQFNLWYLSLLTIWLYYSLGEVQRCQFFEVAKVKRQGPHPKEEPKDKPKQTN